MDRASIKGTAKKLIKNKVFTLFAILLLVEFGIGILSAIPAVGGIITLLITGSITLSLTYIFLGLADKKRMPVIEDIIYGFRDDNFLRSFVAYILVYICTFLWTLLLIIPGIVKAMAYSQTFYILADHPKIEAADAQKRSIAMMKGHKWEYFMLQLSFIPWHIAAILTFGLLYIYVAPYISTTNAVYYKRLSAEYTKQQVSQKVEEVKEAVVETAEKVKQAVSKKK